MIAFAEINLISYFSLSSPSTSCESILFGSTVNASPFTPNEPNEYDLILSSSFLNVL